MTSFPPSRAAKGEAISQPISCLSWSTGSLLACGAWDSWVRIWDVEEGPDSSLTSYFRGGLELPGPVLDVSFKSRFAVFAGGCCGGATEAAFSDGGDLAVVQRYPHEQPVKGVHWLQDRGVLLTGSWDGKVRWFDGRVGAVAQNELTLGRPFVAMDVVGDVVCIATSRDVTAYDLAAGKTIRKIAVHENMQSQLRCIGVNPAGSAFVAGSIEGRCCVTFIDQKFESVNFSFTCHRDRTNIYPVQSVSFHPVTGAFATSGSDGTVSVWNYRSRTLIATMAHHTLPIPCARFHPTGNWLAYAVSYDFTRGVHGAQMYTAPRICVKPVTAADVDRTS